MTGMEIFLGIAGTLGLADLARITIEKFFSKKKDEFSILKERLDYTERELSRVVKEQATDRRKISKMYAFLVRITPETCTKRDCKYRELINMNFAEFEDIEDDKKENIEIDDAE